jgi:hypothetical protein
LCSKDHFVVNQTLVFKINFCNKNFALRLAAKRFSEAYFWKWIVQKITEARFVLFFMRTKRASVIWEHSNKRA